MSLTRANILEMVRDRIGDDSASPYYASTFINRRIDRRVLVLATTKIVTLDPSWYLKEETVTSVANQADYTIATDFFAIVMVERRSGSSAPYTYIEVPIRNQEYQENRGWVTPILHLPDTTSRTGKTFALFGKNKYRIDPVPVDTSEVYRVKYLRRPITTDITDGTEVMDIPDQFGDLVAMYVARDVYERKGDPRLGPLLNDIEKEEANLRKTARRRQKGAKIGRLERM